MQDIKDNIVKVTSPGGYGSGFTFLLNSDEDLVCLVTARHNLINEDEDIKWNADQLAISYSIGNALYNFVLKSEKINCGISNKSEDIGVVLIAKEKFVGVSHWLTSSNLCKLSGKEKEANVCGFSKLTNGELIRTLYKLKILSDKDYNDEIQLEVSDPLSNEYNADNLVEGYSGSPIAISSGDQQFIAGIFCAYEKTTKRVLGINFNILNRLLTEIGCNPLNLAEVETDETKLNDIAKLRENTNRVVSRIRNTIGSINLERTQEVDILKGLIETNKLVVVCGKAGSGKSALTKSVLKSLSQKYEIIALQGEQLDKSDINSIFCTAPFSFKTAFRELINSSSLLKNKIVLVDSVEKILEANNSETILDFLEILKANSDVKLIITCRTYAIENLKIRFLHALPSFVPYVVPLLSEEELITVEKQYTHIKPMLDKPSLRKIFQIPFNVDKAVTIIKEIDVSKLNSEVDFRRLMWSYIIENAEKKSSSVQQERGRLFSEIAIRRAEKMITYITIDNANIDIISELNADNLIDVNPNDKISYAASHDIYEDWALTRHINKLYEENINNNFNPSKFYEDLGTAASIRRAFRIWMTEKVQTVDFDLSKLVKYTLQGDGVRYWKDEILIAILQSDYSESFFEDNRDLLFEDDFRILKRCLLLISVACQQPDFTSLSNTAERQLLYHKSYLMPFGSGWVNIINFCYANLHVISRILPSVVAVILDWQKSLTSIKLPLEAKNAGLIILEYFREEVFLQEEDGYRTSNRDQIEEAIRLLFRLTPAIYKELKVFILKALNERDGDDYRLRNLYDKVMEFTLSGDESIIVCFLLPDVVLAVAEKEWFYYPPTTEELKEKYGDDLRFLYTDSYFKRGKEFGVDDDSPSDYFPAGPLKTSIGNLLYFRPLETLVFVTKLLNHSTLSYLGTDYALNNEFINPNDLREEISIILDDGTLVKQHCSMTLWSMYRGTYVTVPDLLKSVLMAVEDWLLTTLKRLSEEIDDVKKAKDQQLIDEACSILLKQSNNVTTTAILVSVAFAYSDALKKWIIPILRVRPIYNWDLYRFVRERSAITMAGSRANAKYHFDKLKEFNNLSHRQKTLQDLVLKYSFTDPVIFSIIDEFYKEAGEDVNWRMLLNRMDRRTWKIVKEVEEGFIVQSELPEDLKAIHEASEIQEQQKEPIVRAASWALRKFHNDFVEDASYEKWKSSFESATAVTEIKLSKIENPPTVVAAVGIRDYVDKLTQKEKEVCINLVIQAVKYELSKAPFSMDELRNSQYSGFEIQAAFEVLPLVLVSGSDKKLIKELIFVSLLRLEDKSCKDSLIKGLNKEIWKLQPEFMVSCIKGILKYSEVAYISNIVDPDTLRNQRRISFVMSVQNGFQKFFKWIKDLFRSSKSVSTQQRMSNEDLHELYLNTCNNIQRGIVANEINLDITSYNFDQRGSLFYLFEVLKIIPPDTTINEIRIYVHRLLQFVFENIDTERGWSGDKIHFESRQRLQHYLARFMLNQPHDVALKMFDDITKPAFSGELQRTYSRGKDELIERILDDTIGEVIGNELLTDRFWVLWTHFMDQCIKHGQRPYGEKLLLNHGFFKVDTSWEPLKDRKSLIEKAVRHTLDIDATAKLVATIGYSELMPDAILWISELIQGEWSEDKNTLYYLEKISIKTFYHPEYRKLIRNSAQFRNSFVAILDQLIDVKFSSTAYVIREDLISTSR